MKNYEIRIKINDRDIECYKIKANSEEEAIKKCKSNNSIIYYNYENRNHKQ